MDEKVILKLYEEESGEFICEVEVDDELITILVEVGLKKVLTDFIESRNSKEGE